MQKLSGEQWQKRGVKMKSGNTVKAKGKYKTFVTGTNLNVRGRKDLSEIVKTQQLTPRTPEVFVYTVMQI